MSDLPPRSASLKPFFTPNGVAVLGASRDPTKLGYGVIRNLAHPERGYRGPIYPVNPKSEEVLGLRCYPDISAVPDPVELAVIVLPATLVAGALEACGRRGVKGAVVISGGFREIGAEGADRESQLVEIARRHGMRVMGPNGIGVVDTHTPLNTTFLVRMPPKGHIAFVSQSGALCAAIIDWTAGRGIGVSRLLSIGNEADINETDAIPFLAADEVSRVLTLYLEDVKGGPAFFKALVEASARKPVLAMKTGRTASGQVATASHTGALAGAHAGFRAACKQAGVIEIESVQALFEGALALAYQPLPAGNRIAIITNAGGPAVLAADAFEAAGLRLARTSAETQARLRSMVHPDAQVGGPVDLLGGANHEDYGRALNAVLADPACDGVLASVVPHALIDPAAVVEQIAQAIQSQGEPRKPLLACLMGSVSVGDAYRIAHAAQIPAYTFPEDTVAAFGVLWQRARWVHRQTAPAASVGARHAVPLQEKMARRQGEVHALFAAVRAQGRRALDAAEGRAVLEAYGIPTPADLLATTADEAASCARRIGFPVALKLASPDILHKTEVGGVLLDVRDEAAARAGFEAIVARGRAAHQDAVIRGVQVQQMITGGQEVIVGMKVDPTFGPLVMFGLGGIYVEVLADVSFRLAPLTLSDAQEMLEEVRSARLLAGVRGAAPADRAALAEVIVRVGDLAAAHPEIAELDINPLLVLPEGQGALAADVRIILN